MSYEGVMRLAREHPFRPTSRFSVDWLKVIRGCYEEAKSHEGKRFAGTWVVDRVGWFPGLKILERYGILRKVGRTVRGGRRAYWEMLDIGETARALRELGYL